MKILKFSETLESELPFIIKKIAEDNNINVFMDNPDFLEERLEKWHQFGLLTHTKKVREAYLNELPILLEKFKIKKEIQKKLAEEIEGVKKEELFELSTLLHDLGKIVVFGNKEKDRNHEIFSKFLLSKEFLKQKLDLFKLSEKQIDYLAKCISTHDIIGKRVRDVLKEEDKLNLLYITEKNLTDIFKEIIKEYEEIKTEIGIFFICDSLGKTDIRINVKTDEEIQKKESEIISILYLRNLNPLLKNAVMQLPINIKLAEIYLKYIILNKKT